MIKIKPEMEVSTIAVEAPSTIKVFEKLGIDFCCGGKKALEEVCAKSGYDVSSVLAELNSALDKGVPASTMHWENASLALLCRHIVSHHHKFTQNELMRLGRMMVKVVERHGKQHPEVASMQVLLKKLDAEMHTHMDKEEQILFPYIEALENGSIAGHPSATSPFGTVENPIHMMMMEHDEAGGMLRQLRSLSNDFKPPADACPTFVGLYQGFMDLEADLHVHIHLENNILFPRTMELEKKVLQTT
jgi:regulator of cell morphogenesis and NO signaling